jgi:uncharacterized membrane protein SpoIIM required for sporulation
MEREQLIQSKEIKKEIIVTFLKCLIVFCSILVLSMIIVKLFVTIEDIENLFKNLVKDKEISNSLKENMTILDLWVHNSIANLIWISLGFIPFLYIARIGLYYNSILMGAVCAILSIVENKGLLVCFIYGYGAHGVIENFANVLGFTIGILICRNITKIIKKKADIHSIWEKLKFYLIIYCSVIIPMLLVAAILEAKVTPMILNQL